HPGTACRPYALQTGAVAPAPLCRRHRFDLVHVAVAARSPPWPGAAGTGRSWIITQGWHSASPGMMESSMPSLRWIPLRDFPAQRIGLIKPSALGDIVHSLPVLTALRQRYPSAHITWVVNRSYAELLRGHPDLDAVLPFDRGASRAGLLTAARNYGRFFKSLRQAHLDLVIDLQGLLRSGMMAACSGATRRVGLSSAREGARIFY